MIITRRSLLGFLAAPAIIRVADLMPVRSIILPPKIAIVSGGFTAEELAYISNSAISWYTTESVWHPPLLPIRMGSGRGSA